MSCWALVPVNERAACKSRLAGQLSPAQRLALVRLMLAQVVAALRESNLVDAIAFVSAERDTIPAEIPVLPDAGGGLNPALEGARQRLIERGADALVVLPADLPFVTGRDIDALVEAGRDAGVALATDHPGLGTNALWLPARIPFRFQFGPGSPRRHLDEAQRLGLVPALVSSPGLAFDVDGPEDLESLLASGDPRYLSPGGSPRNRQWSVRRQTRCG
jgi:2-phospho-L-lactate/phosphoenolpyruvate guanylyltransferase